MADKKIFIGSVKVKNEKWIQLTIPEKALQILMDNLQEYNGNRFAKINLSILDEPNKYGKNVELTLDTWTPSVNYKPREPQKIMETPDKAKDESLPF